MESSGTRIGRTLTSTRTRNRLFENDIKVLTNQDGNGDELQR